MNLAAIPNPKPRVALLIDGENLSPAVAGQIIMKSLQFGDLAIRRVYGNAASLGGWNSAPGIRPIHSGTGKNATDLLMTVEAMSFILGAHAEVLVLATSDRDFVHLVTHLREKSIRVIGLGEAKAPEMFRKSCSTFIELKSAEPTAASPTSGPVASLSDLDGKIRALILSEGEKGSLLIGRLGGRMHAKHEVRVSELPEKTWRAYLLARPEVYDCDERGPEACVRLKP